MSKEAPRHNQHVSDRLHPFIFKVIVGLGLWLILSVWGFGGAGGHTVLALAVASLVVAIAIGMSLVLRRITRHARAARQQWGDRDREPLADWLSGEFESSSGRLTGFNALVTLILPIAAVSLGMTVFAIVLHVVEKSSS